MAVPEERRLWNQLGNAVADATVNREVITIDERVGHIALVSQPPTVTRQDAVAKEYAIEEVVIGSGVSSGMTISSLSELSDIVDDTFALLSLLRLSRVPSPTVAR
jgi:hypothetical protein